MDERIKELRKTLGLTQQKFADAIGVRQNTVAQYEMGRNPPNDTVITLICREFNVNEIWLRTGEGEMFRQQSRDEELAGLMGQLLATRPESFRRRLISVLLKFDPNGPEWQAIETIYEAIKREAQD